MLWVCERLRAKIVIFQNSSTPVGHWILSGEHTAEVSWWTTSSKECCFTRIWWSLDWVGGEVRILGGSDQSGWHPGLAQGGGCESVIPALWLDSGNQSGPFCSVEVLATQVRAEKMFLGGWQAAGPLLAYGVNAKCSVNDLNKAYPSSNVREIRSDCVA